MATGSSNESEIRTFLDTCTDAQHAAVSFLCVERMREAVEFFFGGDMRMTELRAILLAAASGTVAPADARDLRAFYEAKIGELYDADEQGYPLYALRSLAGALATHAPHDWDHREDVAFNLLDVAASVAGEGAAESEARWLVEAIRFIRGSNDLSQVALLPFASEPEWMDAFRRENGLPGPTAD